MAKDNLTIEAGGQVSLADFATLIGQFRLLVDGLTAEVAGGTLRWVVDDLEMGSTRATVRAIAETQDDLGRAERVVDAYDRAGQALEKGEAIPFSDPVARPIAVLSGLLPRVEYLRFETPEHEHTVTAAEQGKVVPLYPRIPPTLGAVVGRIQTLSSRGGLRFTLYDRATDRAVSCYMQAGQEDLLRDMWGKLVVVEGVVSRDPVIGRPTAVRRVTAIVSRGDFEPGSWRLALGVVSLGERPEQIIRRLRDA